MKRDTREDLLNAALTLFAAVAFILACTVEGCLL